MRVAQAVLLLGASVVQTDAAIDLQKIQDDYQNQVALSVVAALDNLMSLAFKPIEMSLATLDHEFVDLYADGALGLHKAPGDTAAPAWQMFYHQSVVTNFQLGMVYAGMETGEFWGYFNDGYTMYRRADLSPVTEFDFAPFDNLTEFNAAGLNIVPGMHAQYNCTEHYLEQLEVEQDSEALEDLEAGVGEPSEECLDSNMASFYAHDGRGMLEDVFIWLPYDARIRPWYQQSVAHYEASGRTNRFLWSDIYLFTPDAEGNVNQGITSTAVITEPGNPNGDVMGVLAVDAQLGHLSTYLKETFADTDLVVYLVENKDSRLLVASSNEYPVVDPADGVTRLSPYTTGDELVKGTGERLEELNWAVNKTVYQQYDVQTRSFNDGRGVDWIVVIVSPIQCDANQYFLEGSCMDCPFLTMVNTDPDTAAAYPCVCEKGMFDISGLDVKGAFCFDRDYVANPLDDMDGYDHYHADKVEKGLQCSTCPPCMDCDTTRGMVLLKPGWKTIDAADQSADSFDIDILDRLQLSADVNALKCPVEGACLGDVIENGTIKSRCARGYAGRLCATCADGFSFTRNGCEECSAESLLVIPILFVGTVVFGVFYVYFEHWFTEGGAAYADLFFEVERLAAPIGKVFITTSQIIGSIPLTMNIMFPPAMMALVNFLRIFALDVFVILRTNCLFGNSFYSKFYSSIFIPVFAILIFFGYSAWKASKYKLPNLDTLTHKQRKNLRDEYESLAKRGGPENNEVTAGDISACCDDIGVDMSIDEIEAIILEGDKNHSGALGFDQFLDILHAGSGKFPELITAFDRRRHMQGVYAIVGVIVFMLYPGVCQTAFAALRCRDLGDGVSVLEADYAIECESSKYQLFRVFAMFTILAVPVGIPVGAFLLMRKSEEKILAEDLDTLRQFNVLVGDYEPQYYYWECIELGRKLILAGFIMFVAPGGPIQIAIAVVVSFGFFAMSMRCTPYAHPAHDIVKALSEITIFLVLLSVMLMKPSLVTKQLEALSNATVAAVSFMAFLIVFFTARAAKQLIGGILADMRGLDARAAKVTNPMVSELDNPLVGISSSDEEED